MLLPGTPEAPHVVNFCKRVAPNENPVTVVCKPVAGEPVSECFAITKRQIEMFGGESVIGWAIWERDGVFIEAEFHAVWRNPDHELFDVVPRIFAFSEITFLPDRNRKYIGRQVDNIRHALAKDRDVVRFLYLASKRFEIMNTGDLADKHGEVTLPPKLARAYIKVAKEARVLELKIEKKYPSRADCL